MTHHLLCSECGASFDPAPDRLVCPICAVHQIAGRETRGVLEVVPHEPPTRWPQDPSGRSKFCRAFLPDGDSLDLAPLAVGNTPLLEAPRLRKELGLPSLWIKDDSRNPSGSTKDRASLLVAAMARRFHIRTIAAASTGNAATALAAVCAADGLEAVVFVPAAAPPAKLVQILSYGATLIPVAGTYDEAFDLCLECCRQFGWYNRNTALNPYTIEGKKTAALEIAAQLQPEAPEVVVVPTGDGVIISGIAKGFADLVAAGLLQRSPRLIAVQPHGSSAIVRALERGAPSTEPLIGAASVADSLVVESPRNARLCLRRVRESGGCGVAVPDEAILASIARLARLSGVFAEPAAAAGLAGLEAAIDAQLIDRDERIVLLVTGTGLKDVPAAARGVTVPDPVVPELQAVAERLGLG